MATTKAHINIEIASAVRERYPHLVQHGLSYAINSLICKAMKLPKPSTPNEIKRLEAIRREANKKQPGYKPKKPRAKFP